MNPILRRLLLATATVATIIFLPLLLGSLWTKVITSTVIFALAALGVSVLFARLGLVNLAQVALIGVGGWILLRLSFGTELPFSLMLVASAFGTAAVGAMLALPALRLRGLYLALVTLMAAGAFQILFNAYQFPNGGEGFWGVAQQSAGAVRRPAFASSDTNYLRYTMIVAALGFGIVALHLATAPGRAWAMIRQSEANAMAAGVDVTRYKLWAFALSGFLAGGAGALLAGALGRLDARSFIAGDSILLFCLAIVGGAFHWLGALLAGVLFKLLPALFNDWGLSADLTMIVFGVALLHAMVTAPEGIAGQILGALKRRVRSPVVPR